MSLKILMGEGLDILRQGETREYELKKRFDLLKEGKKVDISKLIQDCEAVYSIYIKGLEILNFIRHSTSAHPSVGGKMENQDHQTAEFCASKMVIYMDRCTALRQHINATLLPADQLKIPMIGFVAGADLIIEHSLLLNQDKSAFEKSVEVKRGTYILTVSNEDDYTFLPPEVSLNVRVEPVRETSNFLETRSTTMAIGCRMGYRRVIACTTAAVITIKIAVSGKRDAHVCAELKEWTSACGAMEMGKKSSSAHATATKGTKGAVCLPVSVRPPGTTAGERLELVMLATEGWAKESTVSARLPAEQERFLQLIFALPIPSDVGED